MGDNSRGAPAAGLPAALILFAHGSRDLEWAMPFRAVQNRITQQRPELAVELAFLELMDPSLPAAVERVVTSGRQRVTIAPLFMAQGAHVRRDLAQIVVELKRRHMNVEFKVLPAAGEVDTVIDAMCAWLAAAS